MKESKLRIWVFGLLAAGLMWACQPTEEEVFKGHFCREWQTFLAGEAGGKMMPAPIAARNSSVEFAPNGVAYSHEKTGTKTGVWVRDPLTNTVTITDDSTQQSYELKIEELNDTSMTVTMPDRRYPESGRRSMVVMRAGKHNFEGK
ncbi:MAG: hypothetical protein H6581_01520 [Bacteroidia bacterium]|nr:hypothetical protein [Bacteroidia bacterium]